LSLWFTGGNWSGWLLFSSFLTLLWFALALSGLLFVGKLGSFFSFALRLLLLGSDCCLCFCKSSLKLIDLVTGSEVKFSKCLLN
jgi:hypothetical protein